MGTAEKTPARRAAFWFSRDALLLQAFVMAGLVSVQERCSGLDVIGLQIGPQTG